MNLDVISCQPDTIPLHSVLSGSDVISLTRRVSHVVYCRKSKSNPVPIEYLHYILCTSLLLLHSTTSTTILGPAFKAIGEEYNISLT